MHDDNWAALQSGKLTRKQIEYTVYTGERLERGSAREILQRIRDGARPDSELSRITLDQYARGLVEDADYFIPKPTLTFLRQQVYPTIFDQALVYLAHMDSSQVDVLAIQTVNAGEPQVSTT
ncbi:MAG TPA: hypothetical protein VFC78_23335 [Tepidisphaeraceae bacterium]|nr:hypothetical protein [Tepidisphaeraceae bacterium]